MTVNVNLRDKNKPFRDFPVEYSQFLQHLFSAATVLLGPIFQVDPNVDSITFSRDETEKPEEKSPIILN